MSAPHKSPGLPTLTPDATMARAYLLMQKYNCDTLPVVSDDEVVGVVSMQDIEHLAQNYSAGDRPEALSVGHHMTAGVRTFEASEDLGSAVRLMLNERIQAILVRQGGQTIGILSKDHMLKLLAELSDRSPSSLVEVLKATQAGKVT